MTSMAEASPYGRLALSGLRELERRRLVLRAAFTPTDALHVLGRYEPYDTQSAELAAAILAPKMNLSVTDFCDRIIDGVCRRIAVEVSAKALCDEGAPSGWEGTDGAVALLERALNNGPTGSLAVHLQLQQPLVLVGAPAQAYGPGAAQRLHTEIIVPEHAAVANAVGAVAGGIVQHLRVQVRPTTQDGVFHVLLPDGVVAVRSLAAAVERAHAGATVWLNDVVQQAGAASVEVHHVRRDHTAPVRDQTGETLIETELIFTAVGKPVVTSDPDGQQTS